MGLRAHEAQEVLLVARWFRLNPAELERTVRPPRPSLASGRALRELVQQ